MAEIIRDLLHRQGLAGKGGFIDPQIPDRQQPHVRRHLVAAGQQHNIARHQFRR
ncbi:hypothetical protein BMS3Abin13_01566 [bacterium BMS3Abin13]|nr:hypothetical protein BMS3Abin13_01566 [bacterium BMS3Abin13]